jgi:hypothetical protein
MNNNELALNLAAAGYSVFPLTAEKTPLVRGGYHSATTELEAINQWNKASPKLWGIPCAPNGFFAVDVDPEGIRTWDGWVKQFGLPEPTPTQKTPRGGCHYLFKMPGDIHVPNNAGKLAPGIDLRSDGYIATGGKGYEWQTPLSEPLAECPEWLHGKIKDLTKPPTPSTGKSRTNVPLPQGDAQASYWLEKAQKEVRVGNRNDVGFNLALQLRDSGVSETNALNIMTAYAHSVPQAANSQYTVNEAVKSLAGVYNGTAREPATLPRKPRAPVSLLPEPKVANELNTPPRPPEVHIIPHIVVEPEFVADFATTEASEAGDTEGSGFKVLDMNYFMAERPAIQYIVDGIIAEGSVNLWYGIQGIGKTWSLYDAAVSAACGTEWLGFKVNQANALIVDEESGKRRLGDRIKMIARSRGISHMPLKAISLEQINLLKRPADGDRLTIEIINQGARFVIIDALADIMLGGDENAVKDTQPVFAALRLIAELTGAAIIVIHHSNKLDGYRGSSAIAGAVDTMLHITGNPATGLISYKSEKMRDGSPTSFSAQADWTNGFSLARIENTNQVRPFNKAERYVLRYLKDKNLATVNDIMDHADACAPGTARKAVYTLSDKNYIARQDIGLQGTEATYGLTDAGREQSDQV